MSDSGHGERIVPDVLSDPSTNAACNRPIHAAAARNHAALYLWSLYLLHWVWPAPLSSPLRFLLQLCKFLLAQINQLLVWGVNSVPSAAVFVSDLWSLILIHSSLYLKILPRRSHGILLSLPK